MAEEGTIEALAQRLSQDVRELSLGTSGEIERIEGPPSPLRFLRDFVMLNKPCIISNAISHWPALTAWTNSYLRASLARQCVNVHSTPTGFADAVVDLDRLSVMDCPTYPCMVSEPALDLNPSSNVVEKDVPEDANHRLNANLQGERARKARDFASLIEENGVVCTSMATKDPMMTQSMSCGMSSSFFESRAAIFTENLAPKREENGDLGFGSVSLAGDETSSTDSLIGNDRSPPSKTDETNKPSSAAHGTKAKEENGGSAWFVTAHVDCVLFPTALDMILHSEIGVGVAYAQEQNGCFLSEYSVLSTDAEEHLPWATEAFGSLPEAVNLWIGNEKAVTSFHKDHYENLYAVIAGEKHFTLLPPTDVHRLYVCQYPSAHYVKHNGKFAIQQDIPVKFVPWSSVDPYPAAESAVEAKGRFTEYFSGAKPFTCTVRKGEILYLPSLWFHHVTQSPDMEGRTIALNFWYDMQFDIKYAYYNFLESLVLNLNKVE